MTIDTQLEYLTETIEDQEPPITKQEMEQMLDTIQKSKQVSSYRQVEEAPVVVDVVDISDAAAKKLAQKLKPTERESQINTETKDNSPGFLSKILDFAKGSFVNIIKMIGGVVGWVVGTVTSIISSVTNWVLGKIQKAMVRAVAKSASNMGGRFSKLGLIAKVAGAGAAGLAAWNIYEGIDGFQSKLQGANDTIASVFSNPESILTTGSTPDLTPPPPDQATDSSTVDMTSGDNSASGTSATEDKDNIDVDSQELSEVSLTSDVDPPDITLPLTSASDNQNDDTDLIQKENSNIDITNNLSTTNIDPSSQISNNTTLSTLSELSSEETDQIQKFMKVNDMFDKNSDSVVNDMRDVLNESQTQVNLSSTPGGSSINSTISAPSLGGSSLSNAVPTSGGADTTSGGIDLKPSTSNLNDAVDTVDTANTQTEDVSELYNTVKAQTTDVVNAIQKKTETTSSKSTSGGGNTLTPPAPTTKTSTSASPAIELQSSSTFTPESPTQTIDNSKQSMQSTTQLNNNTNNLHKTSVDLSTRIENLNKQITKKQSPKIVNMDNTQSSTSTDYLTDSDTVRSLARSRL